MAANTAAPAGFINPKPFNSSAPNYAVNEYRIAYNYTGSKIAYGDPVYLYTDGTIRLYANGGTTIRGIFRGCKYLDPNLGRTQWYPSWNAPTLPSTTIVTAYVADDPTLIWQAQVAGSALAQSSVGLNMDITSSSSGAPNAAGISVCSLSGTAASTNTLPFRIVSIVASPAITSAYSEANDNQWLNVMLNTTSVPAGTRTGQA